MSQATIGDIYTTAFSPIFHTAYQQAAPRFKGTYREENVINAGTFKIPTHGKMGVTTRGARGADIALTDGVEAFVMGNVTDYFGRAKVDAPDLDKLNVPLMQEKAKGINAALARQHDDLVIAQLDALGSGGNVIAGGATALTWDKITQAKTLLAVGDVDEMDTFLAISPHGQRDILRFLSQNVQLTNKEQDAVITLRTGQFFAPVLNCTVIISTRLPLVSAGVRASFMWQKQALGVGMQRYIALHTGFDERSMSWLTTGTLQMGTTGIESAGVVEIQNLEA